MSTETEQARLLAERIARRMSGGPRMDSAVQIRSRTQGSVGDELAAMRATLDEMQRRLARIESNVTQSDGAQRESDAGTNDDWNPQQPTRSSMGVRSPWLAGMYVPTAHSSQERFGVEEAAVSELVDFFEAEKKCELEPGGKPCDHCAMCSSRGF